MVGPAGPTTSTRIDKFTPRVLAETGLLGMIGKLERGPTAIEAIKEHGSVYLMALGGAAYLVSQAITRSRVVASEDLGMEAIYVFELKDMPLDGNASNRRAAMDATASFALVWFGEMVPEKNWSAAVAAAEPDDMFLSVGTSVMVYTAAELPLHALGNGSTVAHTNPEPLELSAAEYMLQGPASMLMPEPLAEAFGRTNPH